MATKSTERRAILLMAICASLWSIAGIFIKLIPWHPLTIAGARSLLAAGCMAVYLGACRMHMRINRTSIVSGIFTCLTFLGFVTANKYTTAANAIVLQFTAPVFILILSAIFLKQRFARADLITVFLTLCGISLFFFDQLAPGNLFGNLCAIFAGLMMACMFLLTGYTDPESRMSGLLLGHLFTAVVGIPAAFLTETTMSPTAIGSILVLGIVQLGIPYVLYGIAVKDCPPLVCSLLSAIEPLLNPVWVFLFTREAPGVFALLGGAVVILTITVWCVWRDRRVAAGNSV